MKVPGCAGIASPGFMVRLYDDKVVGQMSDGDLKYHEEGGSATSTKYLAWTVAPFEPRPNVGDTVVRKSEQFGFPKNAPPRVYFVLWRTCSHLEHLPTDTSLTVWVTDGAFIGGQYYKLSCPGGNTALCTYQKE
jgi:hypothetical protein